MPDLKECDPDDACTSVPYEKGHTFLFYLEKLLGGSGKMYISFLILNYFQELDNLWSYLCI